MENVDFSHMLWSSEVMAVPQITIRLPAASKAEFEAYAACMGLKASELVKLLIVRERRRRRLASLSQSGEVVKRVRRPKGAYERLPSITAHVSSLEDQSAFDAYARQCGLNRDSAGAWLLEAELSERWLERVLSAG